MANQPPKDLIGFLDYYLVRKAPFQIPNTAREFIVRFAPWIAVVLLVLSLPVVLLALGLSAAVLPYAPTSASGLGFTMLVVIATLVLDVLALPGLFARRMGGWRLILYARLVTIVSSLLQGAVVGALLGGLISLYILFQIRPLYDAPAIATPDGASA
ncbi:MAG TPA: hypothetical protein VMV51_10245 [Gemmatimonadaceae bacterium]|nr:hypothetical protein [Gemmatimonadaceae bacterium]